VEYAAGRRGIQSGSTQEESAPLSSAQSVLVEGGGDVYKRLPLIIRIDNLDVFVLEIQLRLADFRAVLQSDTNTLLERRDVHSFRARRQFEGAQFDEKQ